MPVRGVSSGLLRESKETRHKVGGEGARRETVPQVPVNLYAVCPPGTLLPENVRLEKYVLASHSVHADRQACRFHMVGSLDMPMYMNSGTRGCGIRK